VQDLQDVEAAASLYVCSGQSWHAALPLAALNFPGAQAAHGPPSGPLKPGSQRQSARRPLWGSENESSGQTSHGSVSSSSSAAASLYVPPAQTRHSCALLSAKPALQRQASGVTEASGERALGSQSWQVVWPWLGWYVSAAHALHAGVVRLSSVCVYPAMHWQRTPPSEGFAVLNGEDTRQDVHAVAPTVDANVFPVQGLHGSFFVVFLKRPIAEGSRFFSADRQGLRVATGTVDAADW
jgi:hypothetical protein